MEAGRMDKDEKVAENRVRRRAERMGLQLVKSRRRDPDAIDYGCFALTQDNIVVFGADSGRFDASLTEVEAFLNNKGDTDSAVTETQAIDALRRISEMRKAKTFNQRKAADALRTIGQYVRQRERKARGRRAPARTER
jgi:hypothetical protein